MKLALVVLDESGSMAASQEETVKAHNAYLDGLAGVVDLVGVMLFNSARISTPEFLAPADHPRLDAESYRPAAITPLYDAVGHAIRQTQEAVRDFELALGQVPDVLIAVVTDGAENASADYDLAQIKAYMTEMETTRGWTFAYMGVGVDAWAAENQALVNAGATMSANAYVVNSTVQAYAATRTTTADWARDITTPTP
jgi:hypothetical protein